MKQCDKVEGFRKSFFFRYVNNALGYIVHTQTSGTSTKFDWDPKVLSFFQSVYQIGHTSSIQLLRGKAFTGQKNKRKFSMEDFV